MPGITILKAGYNADVTLEEFGFEVITFEGEQLHIWFSETDTLRRLSGPLLSKGLLERIDKEKSGKPGAGAGSQTVWIGALGPEPKLN